MKLPVYERFDENHEMVRYVLLGVFRVEPMPGTPADAAKFFADETALWGKVIKEANVTVK